MTPETFLLDPRQRLDQMSHQPKSKLQSRLEKCPWDVIEGIASHMRQSDFVRLCKTSRGFYQLAQPLLWRHPKISDHGNLTLCTNYLNRPLVTTVPRLEDWDVACWDRHMQVRNVTLRLDPGIGLNELASDLLHRLAKYCPLVQVKLFFNGKLDQEYLLKDPRTFFPRVAVMCVSNVGVSPDPRHIARRPKPPTIDTQAAHCLSGHEHVKMAEQVIRQLKREISEDKKQEAMAEKLHPCWTIVPTGWDGIYDCTTYVVRSDESSDPPSISELPGS